MAFFTDSLPYLQSFFQLNFLFSGLEVSSGIVLAARICIFALFGSGLLWASFKIIVKILDCLQTFISVIGPLPKIFFLLMILVVPLSPDSIGARWTGYILLVAAILGVTCSGILLIILWKYGVDQALSMVRNLRYKQSPEMDRASERTFQHENAIVNSGEIS